jgi:hypothetical protein
MGSPADIDRVGEEAVRREGWEDKEEIEMAAVGVAKKVAAVGVVKGAAFAEDFPSSPSELKRNASEERKQ